jgi:hypothetical protein
MSAKVDYLNASESPIVRILNYLAVTAPSDVLFESLLADMQTLGAIPQQYISNARNKFNVVHGNTSSAANTLDIEEVSVALLLDDGSDVGEENGGIQTSHVMDYDANKDNEGFSSPSAAAEDEGINNVMVCQEVAAADKGLSVLSRKRKQPSSEEEENRRLENAARQWNSGCKCYAQGCTNAAVNGIVCNEHGATRKMKRCNSEGCKNQAYYAEGVCVRHGGKRLCSKDGCTNQVYSGGVCIRHGAKVKLCNSDGCTNQARKGGVCIRHGGAKLCNSEGCSNQAVRGGVCISHGAKRPCSREGCSNQVVNRGVCKRHGAEVKVKQCSKEGCTNQAKKGGVCMRHGAKLDVKLCSREGCPNNAVSGGVCAKHGTKEVKRCSSEGCRNQAQSGGMCYRHGAKRTLTSTDSQNASRKTNDASTAFGSSAGQSQPSEHEPEGSSTRRGGRGAIIEQGGASIPGEVAIRQEI